jgi:hypothetical protein
MHGGAKVRHGMVEEIFADAVSFVLNYFLRDPFTRAHPFFILV